MILVAVLGAGAFGARSCQESQVRITQQQAVGAARGAIDFRPSRTQVRLVRQGVSARPYWAVSLSIPARGGREEFRRLAVVRVDARTGKLVEVKGDGRGRAR